MITFFAHSSSEDNDAGVRSGWNDPVLSEQGLQQALELREAVSHLRFDRIYTSDLRRAVQTAEIAFPGMKVIQDVRLREMNYGALNGRPATSFAADERSCIDHPFPNGECCLDVQSRVRKFLADCYKPDDCVAVIAHRFTQLALEVLIRGCDWTTALEQDWRCDGDWKPGWIYDEGT